jgi:flagellar biosynthesis/type III secretory pathway protein FliH
VSVYPRAPDPRTHGRQIEQLAFEVVSTQSLRKASDKAAKLVRRGVRRVFAIDVKRSRALEWSAAQNTWRVLKPSGQITDRALDVALPIAALIDSARTDDAMARALIARRNPVIEAMRARGKAEGVRRGEAKGLRRGKAEAVIALLAARRVRLNHTLRNRILGERDLARLERWLARALACTSAAEFLADDLATGRPQRPVRTRRGTTA